MKYIDYHFDITPAGIQFTDSGRDLLKTDFIVAGTCMRAELDDAGRIFLRITNPDTLDYHLGDIEPYELV